MRRLEILHAKIRLRHEPGCEQCELSRPLNVGKVVLEEWQPPSGLVCIHSCPAVLEWFTGRLVDQLLVNADEIAFVTVTNEI